MEQSKTDSHIVSVPILIGRGVGGKGLTIQTALLGHVIVDCVGRDAVDIANVGVELSIVAVVGALVVGI